MSVFEWVCHRLEGAGVQYEIHEHKPTFTAQKLAEVEGVSGHSVVKVVAVFVDGEAKLAILPASCCIDLDQLRTHFRTTEVRLANEPEIVGLFDRCELGTIPPFNCGTEMELIVDERLMESQTIVFSAGSRSHSITMRFKDWYVLVQPEVISFSLAHGGIPYGEYDFQRY